MELWRSGAVGILAACVLLSGCPPADRARNGAAADAVIQRFEYRYNGGGKTELWGEITKETYHIRRASSYPIDYDINGKTQERCWALVEWLHKYGMDRQQQDEHGYFAVKYTLSNGTVEERNRSVDRDHLIMFQILAECTSPPPSAVPAPRPAPTSPDF